MAKFLAPIDFTLESLSENGFRDPTIITIQANEIEFVDKSSVKLHGMSYSIFKDGIKEMCSLIGISSQSLNRYPDDLFAYVMNYFYRRAEDVEIDVYVNEDFAIDSVQMAGTFRLGIEDMINLVRNSYEGNLMLSAFTKKSHAIDMTLVTDRFENEPGLSAFPALTVSLDDRLIWGMSYSLGISFWGPLAKDQSPYLTTKVSKKDSVETLMKRITEDMRISFETLNRWAPSICEKSKDNLVDNPYAIVGKLLAEHGLGRKSEEMLSIAGITDSIDSSYHLAKQIAELSVNDKVNARQSAKLEVTAGYILQHLRSEHRCHECKTLLADG